MKNIIRISGPQACGKSRFIEQLMEISGPNEVLVTYPHLSNSSFISGICENTKYLIIEDASEEDYQQTLKTFKIEPLAFNRKNKEPIYLDNLTIIVVITTE